MSPVCPVKEGQRSYIRMSSPGRIPTSGFSPLYSRITRRHHRHRHPRNHTGRASTSLAFSLSLFLPPAQHCTSQSLPGDPPETKPINRRRTIFCPVEGLTPFRSPMARVTVSSRRVDTSPSSPSPPRFLLRVKTKSSRPYSSTH